MCLRVGVNCLRRVRVHAVSVKWLCLFFVHALFTSMLCSDVFLCCAHCAVSQNKCLHVFVRLGVHTI